MLTKGQSFFETFWPYYLSRLQYPLRLIQWVQYIQLGLDAKNHQTIYHSFTNIMRKMKNSHRGESTELSPFNVTRQAVVTTLLDDLSNQVKTKTIFVVHEHFIGHLFVDMKIFSLEIRILHIYKDGRCKIRNRNISRFKFQIPHSN